MIIKEKNTLYSFPVSLEKEIEEEIEKKSKRKNKKTGKMEVVTSTEKIKVKKDVVFNIYIKKPNRTELEDGDMFYSLELNRFIKMGLLTKAMLAKQYGNQGGVWSEKEQKIYSDLLFKMHKKQIEVQQFSILGDNGKLSKRQEDKLIRATREMSETKRELTEYEMIQNSLFDHTADIKARNRAIMWYILNLSFFVEGDSDESPFECFFEGEDFKEKYKSYEAKEDLNDDLFEKCIDRISSIVTIWYISGEQEKENLDEMLNNMKKDDPDLLEETEEAEETEETKDLVESNG